jgi:hypothetical protein
MHVSTIFIRCFQGCLYLFTAQPSEQDKRTMLESCVEQNGTVNNILYISCSRFTHHFFQRLCSQSPSLFLFIGFGQLIRTALAH